MEWVDSIEWSLKSDSHYDEKWIQSRLKQNPSLLGLGELSLIEDERTQVGEGRLDLLFVDQITGTRFEVELQLGSMDATHIMRCVEYWDLERRRYPGHEHVAVLVAEQVTSRFLNLAMLMFGTVPLVVIKMTALKVGELATLHFLKVVDHRQLRTDDSPAVASQPVDRAYWEQAASPATVGVADRIVEIISEIAERDIELNYTKILHRIARRCEGEQLRILHPAEEVDLGLGES